MKSKKKSKKGKGTNKSPKSNKKDNKGRVSKALKKDIQIITGCLNTKAAENFLRLEQERFGLAKGDLIYETDKGERLWKEQAIESHESKKSWADSFFAIFGFKRK